MATKDEIFAFAAQEAERQGVPLSLVQSVVQAESGGTFNAIGPETRFNDRAYGPMQLMGATAKDLGVNRMDWRDNIRGGVKYLGQLTERFQDPTLVAAAYNAGPGNVEKYGGVPPFKETQNYVKKVVGMAQKDDEQWTPVTGIAQQQAPSEEFKPVTGINVPAQQQVTQRQTVPTTADFMQSIREQAFQPKTQFQQDVAASFNPLDVLRGKTTGGQLITGTANLMSRGIKGGLSALGLSDEYLGIDRTKEQPTLGPTPSLTDILKGTYNVATTRPGLLVGGMGTGLLDPVNLMLPGGLQKSLIAGTPASFAKAAPRTTALAQNVLTGSTTAGITSAAQQAADTGTINPMQLSNEIVAGALMTLPTATVSGLTTPRAPVVLNQKQRIAQAAIDQGAVLPPTQVNPTILNRLLEGYSGKDQTKQLASIKNQNLVNEQARKTLNLAPDTEITPLVLQEFRDKKGLAYDALRANPTYYADKQFFAELNKETAKLQSMKTLDVKTELDLLNNLKVMNFTGDELVNSIKRLRDRSKTNSSALASTENKELGQAQKFAAQQLEALAERNLTNFNQPDVMKNFRQARQDIAKSYNIEKALNAASGDVSAANLGTLASQGKIVPAELQTLANAAATYPNAFQNVARIGSVPGISPVDVIPAAAAAVATSNPSILATIFGRPIVRDIITRPSFQQNMLPSSQPQVPGLLNRVTSNPMTNYGLGQLPEYGTERFLLPR
jgi:hypothetical protein